MTEETPEELPVHPKHRARDRFGKEALQTAHDITRALAEAGVDDDGVVVLRTGGPRPGLADLERLIDEALEEDEALEAEARENEARDDEAGAEVDGRTESGDSDGSAEAPESR